MDYSVMRVRSIGWYRAYIMSLEEERGKGKTLGAYPRRNMPVGIMRSRLSKFGAEPLCEELPYEHQVYVVCQLRKRTYLGDSGSPLLSV